MHTAAFLPYRSEAARDSCFAYLETRAAKEWPIPSRERIVQTPFGPTFARVSGPPDAMPVVLLPGAVTPSLMWAPNIQTLSAEYQTFAIDQIGDFGRSLCTRPIRRYRDLLAWLDAVLEALSPRHPVHLIGISYGGALAAEYARHAPTNVAKLVLLAPGATVLALRFQFIARLMLAAIAPNTRLPSLFRWMFADAVRKDPAWMEATLEQLFLAMRSVRRRLPNPAVWNASQWKSLSAPTLFLVGEHETIYSAEKAVRRLQRIAPSVAAEIISGAGHDLTFAQADIVNRRILEFLRGASAGDPAAVTAARVLP